MKNVSIPGDILSAYANNRRRQEISDADQILEQAARIQASQVRPLDRTIVSNDRDQSNPRRSMREQDKIDRAFRALEETKMVASATLEQLERQAQMLSSIESLEKDTKSFAKSSRKSSFSLPSISLPSIPNPFSLFTRRKSKMVMAESALDDDFGPASGENPLFSGTKQPQAKPEPAKPKPEKSKQEKQIEKELKSEKKAISPKRDEDGEREAAKKLNPNMRSVDQLAILQNFDGSWNLKQLKTFFGSNAGALDTFIRQQNFHPDQEDLWATAIASTPPFFLISISTSHTHTHSLSSVAYLEAKCKDCEAEWSMLASKATKWLRKMAKEDYSTFVEKAQMLVASL
jgi:hypothetical protein